MNNKSKFKTFGLARRVVGFLIDLIVIISIWVAVIAGIVLIRHQAIPPHTLWAESILPCIALLYFLFARQNGKTIGMLSTKIKIKQI